MEYSIHESMGSEHLARPLASMHMGNIPHPANNLRTRVQVVIPAHAWYISTYQEQTRVQVVTINLLEEDRCPNHLPSLPAINTWCYSTWYWDSLSRTLTLTLYFSTCLLRTILILTPEGGYRKNPHLFLPVTRLTGLVL